MNITCYWRDKQNNTQAAAIEFPVLPRIGDTVETEEGELEVKDVVFEVRAAVCLKVFINLKG